MNRRLLILIVCSIVTLIIFLGTDPTKLPVFMLVLPFVTLGVMLFVGVSFVLDGLNFPKGKILHVAVLVTALPLILLILQSVGQLTFRDVLTLSIVFLLSYFYMSRTLLSKQ